MPFFLSIIKIIAIIQVVLIGLLFIGSFSIRAYARFQKKQRAQLAKKFDHILRYEAHHTWAIALEKLNPYQSHLSLFLERVQHFDSQPFPEWRQIRSNLIATLIMPRAKHFATAKNWYKRYTACQAFFLENDHQDETLLIQLIHDPIPLVAVNAAMLAIKSRSQPMIDAVIDSFSKGRRVQQSLYTQIMATAPPTLIPFIQHRLKHDTDPYVKIFCYRVLMIFFPDPNTVKSALLDLQSDNINLKIAVIEYIAYQDPAFAESHFGHFLEHKNWEIRAKTAKIFGEIQAQKMLTPLEKALRDPAWWVRINAAEALAQLGDKGKNRLNRQDPAVDQYAYDAAQRALAKYDSHAKECNASDH